MKKIHILLVLAGLSFPMSAIAGMVFDIGSISTSITSLMDTATKKVTEMQKKVQDKIKLKNEGEEKDLQPVENKPSEVVMLKDDILVITSAEIASELSKEEPSKTAVENVIIKDFYFNPNSLYKADKQEQTYHEITNYQPPKNSLELMQLQAFYAFEIGRAMALKANLKALAENEEVEGLDKEFDNLNNLNDVKRARAKMDYLISTVLNEISVLRNAALQIQTLNNLHGYQGDQKKSSMMDTVKKASGLF